MTNLKGCQEPGTFEHSTATALLQDSSIPAKSPGLYITPGGRKGAREWYTGAEKRNVMWGRPLGAHFHSKHSVGIWVMRARDVCRACARPPRPNSFTPTSVYDLPRVRRDSVDFLKLLCWYCALLLMGNDVKYVFLLFFFFLYVAQRNKICWSYLL